MRRRKPPDVPDPGVSGSATPCRATVGAARTVTTDPGPPVGTPQDRRPRSRYPCARTPAAFHSNKNGFLYTVDRTDCSLIAAHPYVFVNWATHIDLETGRPVLTDLYRDFLAGEEVYIWPSRGTNAVPIAFNPDTGLIYSTTWHVPRIQRLLPEPQEFVLGASSTGVTNRFPVVEPGDLLGHIVAIDPLTGEKKWEIPMHDFPSSAGVLATGGGLLFTGRSPASSSPSTRRPARRCGSSRPGRASTRPRSPTP